MLITLSRRSAICQSVVEVQLTCKIPLGAVSQKLIFKIILYDRPMKRRLNAQREKASD